MLYRPQTTGHRLQATDRPIQHSPQQATGYRLRAGTYSKRGHATGYRPASGYMLQATGYRLPAAGYRLIPTAQPAAGYRLRRRARYRLRITGYRLQANTYSTAGCKLQACELINELAKYTIKRPTLSEFVDPLPHSRGHH